MAIELTGTYDEMSDMFNTLKKLTRDNLTYEISKSEENCGNRILKYEKVSGSKYPAGTALIRKIIDNKYNCLITPSIKVNKIDGNIPKNAYNGVGTGSHIKIDLNNSVSVLTEYTRENKTTGIRYEIIPKEIMIGHELIHALRFMEGKALIGVATYTYQNKDTFFGKKGAVKSASETMEELVTMGIPFYSSNGTYVNASERIMTENSLRAEHGYGRRVCYDSSLL